MKNKFYDYMQYLSRMQNVKKEKLFVIVTKRNKNYNQ